jgi:hypothetical protein
VSFPPPPTSEPVPSLDPESVADDVQLGEAVDAVVFADLDARERMLEIARYAEALRAVLDEGSWRLLMVWDERANARFAEISLVIARFAFKEGRLHPLEPSP